MKENVKFMTRNDCYTAGRKITPKGIVVHSTATPGLMAKDWFSRWNKSYKAGEINRQSCVHAFIDDAEYWQYLPWNHRGWHAGGAANNTHIGIEMCEDKEHTPEYFAKVYENMVELAVKLCKQFGFDEKNIISHAEGYKKGVASNHADVGHWFPKFGKSMDTFREDVRKGLAGEVVKVVVNRGDSVKVKVEVTVEQASKYVGSKAKELQQKLIRVGYSLPKYGADGYFGKETYDQLKKFQEENGLVVDGLAGTKTFAKLDELIQKKTVASNVATSSNINIKKLQEALNSTINAMLVLDGIVGAKTLSACANVTLRRNSRNEAVRWLQNKLNSLGFDCGKADGIFGTKTENAVKRFQAKNGLAADGIVGKNTWSKLIK